MASPGYPVRVNVYDLGEFNGYLNWIGVGIFHSGVEVHGKEYAFGAHMYECSGIFSTAPLEAPGEVTFNRSIDVGTTHCSEGDIELLVERMGAQYQGVSYHLLQTNCNHFSSDLCYALCGKRPPHWINRLAECVVNVHCLFPPAWLPPLKPPTMDPIESAEANAQVSGRAALYARSASVSGADSGPSDTAASSAALDAAFKRGWSGAGSDAALDSAQQQPPQEEQRPLMSAQGDVAVARVQAGS